jgi:TetR/AcrR family fatty acid metabolism transcriptional regulator
MRNDLKKNAIIQAAREVISEKGLMDSTISEIAQKAGVVDSIIYHYFKNKEDLLFCTVDQEFKAVNRELRYHFKGIIGPISKLGKMIWFHLSLNDTHNKDVRILKNLLFESRSYKNFYMHEGYQSLKEYTKIMKSILKQGVKEHFFHKDLNINIVRDMIFGLLDEESISCLEPKEIEKTLPDFDDIMALILNMIARKPKISHHSNNKNNKAEKILYSAKTVFAERGFNKATMAEIANRAGVSEGTIYEYYKNKNDLLFSIPKEYVKAHAAFFKDVDILEYKDPLMKLKCFIFYYYYTFLSDREFIKIYLQDIKLNKKYLSSGLYSEFLNHISVLNDILDEGKEKGCFRSNINNRIFRNLFIGTFTHLSTRWLLFKKTTAIDMMEELDQTIKLLCLAVNNDQEFSLEQRML